MDGAGARGSIPKGESPDRENREPGSGETKAEFCIILQKEIRMESKTEIKKLVNNICPKCGGAVTGSQVEFISNRQVIQVVACDECGCAFRHYYTLYGVEEL